MKSAPTPPPAPDPTVVSTGQANADINSAIAQATLNDVNQVTPQGNLNYNATGSQTVTLPDGSTMQVPQYTATQTLNPTAQQTFDTGQQAQLGLAQTGLAQEGRVASTLATPLSFSNLPTPASSLDESQITQVPTGIDNSGMTALPTGADLSQVNSVQQGLNLGAINQTPTGINTSRAQQLPTGINLSSLGLLPTGVNASALPAQVSGLDNSTIPGVPTGGPQQTENDEAQALYSEGMGFLTPQFTQQNTNLADQLSKQGIPVGSDAWVNAMNQNSNSQNQQSTAILNNAIATGAAQGGTNYGLTLQGNQTAVNQQVANAGLANQAGTFGLSSQGLNSQIANSAVSQILGGQATSAGVGATGAQDVTAAETASAQQSDAAAQNKLSQLVAGAQQGDTAAGLNLQGQQLNANIAQQSNQFNLQDQAQNAQIAQGAATQQTQQQMLSAQLAQAAQQQGISTQEYLYNLPLNQTSALLSGSQVQGPSYVNTPQEQLQAPNVLGAYALQNQAQMNTYNQQMQNYSSGLGGMFGLAGAGLSAGLAPGLGQAGFLMASSRSFKTGNTPIDTSDILDRVNLLPVESWSYKPGIADSGQHMGPYAEDFAQQFGGDSKTIDIITMMGALTASVQELTKLNRAQAQRIEQLETFLVI